MRLELVLLSMTSAAALLGCRGELVIGGELDSGPTLLDSGTSVEHDGSTNEAAADANVPLIHIDGGVGGLCAVADAGNVDGASDAGDDASGDGGDSGASASCACSRRPGTGTSFQCPAGLGEYASATIGAGGGTLTLEGRQGIASGVAAQITLSPGALSTSTDITLIETSIAPPDDLLDFSPVYLVEPPGLVLASPASLRIPWSSSSGSGSDLSIWLSPDGNCFTRVTDSYTNAGFEQGATTRLGYLIVGTPRTAATATCP